MKITFLLSALILSIQLASAQPQWFKLYEDSTTLVNDGKAITAYLIFYWGENGERTANLPKWDQLIEPQKQFFYQVAGSEAAGKDMFRLFFNGFYLPHEL